MLQTAKTHEEMASQAAREAQLRAEELRLLRAEVTQLRNQNVEMKRKMQVELESLQEQLRVRKEKQYSLLERTQAAEEAKRQSDDQVCARLGGPAPHERQAATAWPGALRDAPTHASAPSA